MKRMVAILVLVLSGVVATTATVGAGQNPGSAPVAQAQLQQLILNRTDVGTAFSVAESGPLVDGIVSYGVVFMRESWWTEVVAVGLADPRTGTPRKNALDFVEELSGSRRATELTAPRLGTDNVRYTFEFSKDGTYFYGDVIAWQHQGVVAIVGVVSEDPDACACEYAQKQQTKLANGGARVRR